MLHLFKFFVEYSIIAWLVWIRLVRASGNTIKGPGGSYYKLLVVWNGESGEDGVEWLLCFSGF